MLIEAKIENNPLNNITLPIWIYSSTFFIYSCLLLIKIFGFMRTGSLVLVGEGFTSFFDIIALILMLKMQNLQYQKAVIKGSQSVFIFTGLIFLILGTSRIFIKTPITEPMISILIVLISLLILGAQYSYVWISSKHSDNLSTYAIAKTIRENMSNSLLIIVPIIAELFNIYFFDGFLMIMCGFVCFSKVRAVSSGRNTFHIHVMLAERPYTYDEILNIDNRIAMLFGSPMFLSKGRKRDKLQEFYIQLALLNLVKQGIIEKIDDKYTLTEYGKILANKDAGQLIKFFRFIKKLINPVISPVISLVLHMFLGSLKILGFFVTGSIGLLGDGLDSAIDGISSIVVGIAMRINREVEATYLLLLLMIVTGGTIIFSSIDRLINPAPLQEGGVALIIAAISIILCLVLYLYQRYSGYHNRSLAILAQSEDSKNHVLNAFLVIIAILASLIDVYILDGLVGCFIGFLILQGAYNIFQDLRNISQGGTIDYEKYKLGLWKSYTNFRIGMLDTWILHQIDNGVINLPGLTKNFKSEFKPFKICTPDGDYFTFNYSYNESTLINHMNSLINDHYISTRSDTYFLTETGKNKILNQVNRFRHKR